MSEPLIVGIRHHSPACARLVKSLIESQRPRYVLIEGPADFNDRVDELFLAHQLPVAIYSYCRMPTINGSLMHLSSRQAVAGLIISLPGSFFMCGDTLFEVTAQTRAIFFVIFDDGSGNTFHQVGRLPRAIR